jgi:mannose-6-phosphate isomerase-like protein (cupin superfamily)
MEPAKTKFMRPSLIRSHLKNGCCNLSGRGLFFQQKHSFNMHHPFPFSIENKYGEKITFQRLEGNRLIVDGYCAPGAGPAFHTHLRQDESLTVVSGSMGYQLYGQEPRYAAVGETVLFPKGVAHRFWNAGQDELHVSGWISPAENAVFFLTALYDAFNRGENGRPESFDGAYLICRFRKEYDLPDMPGFVKNVLMPVTYFTGKILGKYRKFSAAL